MLFVCALLTLSLIDIDHQVLPDLLVLPLLWTGLLFNSLSLFVDLHSAVFGAVAGYLVLWLSSQAHHILTGRAGMGYGDFKLFAAIGAWLGVQMLPVVLAMACIICLLFIVYRKCFYGQGMRVSVCFGPLSVIGCVCNDTYVARGCEFRIVGTALFMNLMVPVSLSNFIDSVVRYSGSRSFDWPDNYPETVFL